MNNLVFQLFIHRAIDFLNSDTRYLLDLIEFFCISWIKCDQLTHQQNYVLQIASYYKLKILSGWEV